MPHAPYTVHAFVSFTLALMLLFVGKAVIARSALLRRYSIPEPVIGGLLCALAVAALHYGPGLRIAFDVGVRDTLLLYFFAGVGLKADVRTLLRGGRPLLVLLALASLFLLLQNGLGMAVARAFGLDARAGLLTGSVSLTGGAGTTLAWAPIFAERLGIDNALELGLAGNTVGLVAGCIVGGPLAEHLIARHRLTTSRDPGLDVGVAHETAPPPIRHHDLLWAWMWLNLTLMLGYGLGTLVDGLGEDLGFTLPRFVSCLLAGIVMGNLLPRQVRGDGERAQGIQQGFALTSDICLGLFLTMALMDLQLWQLQRSALFIAVVMTLQVAMAVAFALYVVFPAMGRDYEASVVSAGFAGISLGTTATAIISMTAVTQQHGAAHRAFIVVPLVGGFFIDLVNALAIGLLAR